MGDTLVEINKQLHSEELAVWSAAYVNDLPDDAFAYISPGGEKDSDGKTVPRSLRHLPYKDKEGNIDSAHVRNALARLPQTDIPASAKAEARKKLIVAAKKVGIEVSEEEKMEENKMSEEKPASDKAEVKTETKVESPAPIVEAKPAALEEKVSEVSELKARVEKLEKFIESLKLDEFVARLSSLEALSKDKDKKVEPAVVAENKPVESELEKKVETLSLDVEAIKNAPVKRSLKVGDMSNDSKQQFAALSERDKYLVMFEQLRKANPSE